MSTYQSFFSFLFLLLFMMLFMVSADIVTRSVSIHVFWWTLGNTSNWAACRISLSWRVHVIWLLIDLHGTSSLLHLPTANKSRLLLCSHVFLKLRGWRPVEILLLVLELNIPVRGGGGWLKYLPYIVYSSICSCTSYLKVLSVIFVSSRTFRTFFQVDRASFQLTCSACWSIYLDTNAVWQDVCVDTCTSATAMSC